MMSERMTAPTPTMEETPSLSPREQGDLLPQEAHRQVRFFIVYYTVLLVLSLLALGFLWQNASVVQQWAAPQWLRTLILPLSTTMVGGMMGNVLYSIRVMYNHYIKKRDYDPKWWGKYFSGPFEAAVLALVVYALLRGGVASMAGISLTSEAIPGQEGTVMLSALGLGALVGFSIRDVVGWLQALSATIFRQDEARS